MTPESDDGFWQRYSVHIVGVALLVLGALATWAVAWRTIPWPEANDLTKAIGEAAVVAGALALIVDPFLKRRLVKEASKGIFKHMLGFDQPPEIRDRLEKILLGTKLYISHKTIACRLSVAPDRPDVVQLEVTSSWWVHNPTGRALEYRHSAAFERSEKPSKVVLMRISDDGYTASGPLSENNEPGVLWTQEKASLIPPGLRGVSFQTQYSCEHRIDDHHDFAVGQTPVIGTTLIVDAPPGLQVEASPGVRQDGTWLYDDLFMTGDRVTLRWFPIGSGAST